MRVDLHRNVSFCVRIELDTSAKIIDSGQPAQSAQADLGRKILLRVNFLHIKGPYYLMIHLVFQTERRMRKVKACMTVSIRHTWVMGAIISLGCNWWKNMHNRKYTALHKPLP